MCLCKHRKKNNNRILDRTDKEELVNMTVFSEDEKNMTIFTEDEKFMTVDEKRKMKKTLSSFAKMIVRVMFIFIIFT